MDHLMMIVIVPLGQADRVARAAKEAGAVSATILRARGADNSAKEGLLGFKIEPEEEIILIVATQEVANTVCSQIHDEFDKDNSRSGSIYILPVQRVGGDADPEQ